MNVPEQICKPGQCSHRTRAEKRAAHGTPSEFADAVWRAQGDGSVTADEAFTAISIYKNDYAAPEEE